ncbi:Lipoyl-binding domain-containing protein [Planctomycetales bacterium 10988]|nr:Lipoyl-binding domain-containing protein [Planctomycetales bacterium 10988]
MLVLPDLNLPATTPVQASVYLVPEGNTFFLGDRLLEVFAGSATFDLPAPVSGRLVEWLVDEGETLTIGQELAILEATDL